MLLRGCAKQQLQRALRPLSCVRFASNKIDEEYYGRKRIYTDLKTNNFTYDSTSHKALSSSLRSMFLPIQYPTSVHKNYLRFHVWQAVETYVSAVVGVLCNQAMLSALGLNHVQATTGAVAIQWVLKDGIAEIGKLLFIMQSARSFDSHPKTWKLIGEFLTTFGSALQLCTIFYPEKFLLLAAGGNVAKSISWALWGATHFWFTRHFALQSNIGDLTGKSEAQSAFALIAGWLSGVMILSVDHSPAWLFGTFFALAPAHAIATWNLLKYAEFEVFSQAKAQAVVEKYVNEGKVLKTGRIPGVWLGEWSKGTKIVLGSSLKRAFDSLSDAMLCIETIRAEDYLIGYTKKKELYVVLHKDSEGRDTLKALLHAYKFNQLLDQNDAKNKVYSDPQILHLLRVSHQWTIEMFPSFVAKLEAVDWNTESVLFDDPGFRCHWEKLPKVDSVAIEDAEK